jgi:hypothetical protein
MMWYSSLCCRVESRRFLTFLCCRVENRGFVDHVDCRVTLVPRSAYARRTIGPKPPAQSITAALAPRPASEAPTQAALAHEATNGLESAGPSTSTGLL